MTLDELRASGKATISPAETFDLLGIGKNFGYRELQAGSIPGLLRIGSRWRVSVPALLRFLDAGPAPPENEETPAIAAAGAMDSSVGTGGSSDAPA